MRKRNMKQPNTQYVASTQVFKLASFLFHFSVLTKQHIVFHGLFQEVPKEKQLLIIPTKRFLSHIVCFRLNTVQWKCLTMQFNSLLELREFSFTFCSTVPWRFTKYAVSSRQSLLIISQSHILKCKFTFLNIFLFLPLVHFPSRRQQRDKKSNNKQLRLPSSSNYW